MLPRDRARARLRRRSTNSKALQHDLSRCARSWRRCGDARPNRREQLLARLQDWCQRAEASGIAPLAQFSLQLQAATRSRYSPDDKKPAEFAGFFSLELLRRLATAASTANAAYFSFVSLYITCLRATGSNFMISILSGMIFLFFDVV